MGQGSDPPGFPCDMDVFPNDLTGLIVAGLNTYFLAFKEVVFRYSPAADTKLIVDFVEFLERVGSF